MAQNFPFWNTLSEEARQAYEIAERMLQNQETIGQASKFLNRRGISWSAERLANGLKKVTEAMEQYGVESPQATQVITHGTEAATEAMEAAAMEAAAEQGIVRRALSAIGRWILKRLGLSEGVSLVGATLTGALAATVVLGLLAWGLSSWLGSLSGGHSVQLGEQKNKSHYARVDVPGCQSAGPYFIYVLNIESGGSIYICGKEGAQKPSCNFVDGGPPPCAGQPNVGVLGTLDKSEGYDTYDQAVAAYCRMRTETHPAYGGTKGTVNGQLYWLDNAPKCPGD
ncbi:hypothetical protein [Ktedonospora formicarum]|uniref:Uncharacterized protein n=1 Tax=Ktedonospora formicarum TaxID=2778364 RepID=A0A8J3MYP1_9CHLR|nr:hypothetical protein [Ktedonospora formicarum]GHO49880.1 hypothetical protein KSX_80430 [Ktedonospora formicarum]